MTNAPERIWIEDEFGDGDDDQWAYGTWDVRNYRGYVVEYVRADIVQALTAERDRLRCVTDNHVALCRAEKAEAERDEALWQAECAKDTLSAWFDRRELGHEAVDQAVVDAASGYLRTSRAGGMPRKQSDLIIGVIQDMARLGLFADLFARAALKGESNE